MALQRVLVEVPEDILMNSPVFESEALGFGVLLTSYLECPSVLIQTWSIGLYKPGKVTAFAKLLRRQDAGRYPCCGVPWDKEDQLPCFRINNDNIISTNPPWLCCFIVAIATKGKMLSL